MSLLDDTAIFAAIVSQGGFAKAAKKLGLSNGLISRRLAKLEEKLGVALLIRTTRQIKLTPEGELFWEHAKRIQQELDSAVCVLQSYADKPTGEIHVSAPPYFGRHFLMPILNQFMANFEGIRIKLILSDQYLDPIKENFDLLIRGTGYFEQELKDSSLKNKLLIKMKIKLCATREYLMRNGVPTTPEDLAKHAVIGFTCEGRKEEGETWAYRYKGNSSAITLKPMFNCNDMDSRVSACLASQGISKITELMFMNLADRNALLPVLPDYDWGDFKIYAVYAQQHALPKRTRLLLDFISSQTQHLQDKIG